MLNIESTINSSVSLLAIDQRVLNQGSGYDITKDFIFNEELIKYDWTPSEVNEPEIPFWFYKNSYQKKFIDVGAVILTNAIQEVPCLSTIAPDTTEISTEASSGATYTTSKPVSVPPLSTRDEVDKNFLDTFLFQTITVTTPLNEMSVRGIESLTETAPALATSWIISGIAMSNKFGLGLTTSPAVLNAFLTFYIDFIVPRSVKIGEVITLEFLIVSLFEEALTADVEFIDDNRKFDVIRPLLYNWTIVTGGYVQDVIMQNRSIYRCRIEIRPKQIGYVELKVKATSAKAGDVVVRELLVVPEGFPTYENHAEFVYIEECDKDGKRLSFTCSLPPEALTETVQVHASISGDVLGPALANLESLIRMPSGCGEQTMINFVPNIVALDYLSMTNRLTLALKATAIGYLESAYQRMLKFRHSDGSFSAFGKNDKNGSTWLSAYVAKSLREAKKYIDIDEQVIKEALDFLETKQEANGKFREDGVVFHKSLQSGTGSGVAFTSYIAIVFQENLSLYPQYYLSVKNAISYVHANSDPNDVYSQALATYLFYYANDLDKVSAYTQLSSKAIKKSNYMYWKNQPATNSLDIETTAYGLLVLDLIPQLYEDGFKVLQWLVSQQNSRGGFQSTQDTVVALQAISKFASKFSTEKTDLKVDLYPEHGLKISTKINNLVTQKFQLEDNVRKLNVTMTGKGFAMVQLSCSYFVNRTTQNPGFNISVSFGKESCDNKLVLNIKANLISNNSKDVSNMVVFAIDFPTGFAFDSDTPLSSKIQVSETILKINFYFKSFHFRKLKNLMEDHLPMFT